MRHSRLLAATLLCSLGLAGVTACGPADDKKSDDKKNAAPAASSPAAAGLDTLSAADILKKAQEASSKATSVKLDFDISAEGTKMTGSVAEDSTGNCAGKISLGDKGGLEILRNSASVWLKPDADFWEKSVAPGSSKTLAGKYLSGGVEAAELKEFTAFCDMGLQLLKSIGKTEDGADDTAGATKGGTKQVGSETAVVVKAGDATDGAEIAIAAKGEPYLLQMVSTGGDAGTMTFSDYNKPVTVTPPAAAQVIDAAKYLKG
ncbi:hypothetical protein AB0D08_04335 [Kitasatospora sp. NPDC048540]|uniref:hypothetical protein n=1 Tax=Kitasatospora sp. NPDC048540 TaxID=3155634 RepID=UPI00340F6115